MSSKQKKETVSDSKILIYHFTDNSWSGRKEGHKSSLNCSLRAGDYPAGGCLCATDLNTAVKHE